MFLIRTEIIDLLGSINNAWNLQPRHDIILFRLNPQIFLQHYIAFLQL